MTPPTQTHYHVSTLRSSNLTSNSFSGSKSSAIGFATYTPTSHSPSAISSPNTHDISLNALLLSPSSPAADDDFSTLYTHNVLPLSPSSETSRSISTVAAAFPPPSPSALSFCEGCNVAKLQSAHLSHATVLMLAWFEKNSMP
ncbi:MAG: hypothetical protein L6R41_006647, partial [Letrouitia leprolyta]